MKAILYAVGLSTLSILSLPAEDQGQVDRLTKAETTLGAIPADLSLRVRLVKAATAPDTIGVGFRRGLYWKRAGDLGNVRVGEWTPWKDCQEFFTDKGACDFVIVEFPGCKNFEAEYQLASGGKALKTITEAGRFQFSTIVIPRWLLTRGMSADLPEFLANFQSLTAFNKARLKRFDEYFKNRPRLPQKYTFEANFGGYVDETTKDRNILAVSARHSSPEALRAELGILRHLGYNGFIGENNVLLADLCGMRNEFDHLVTFSHAQAPWYQIACPFDPKLEEKRSAMIASARERAAHLKDMKDIWIHWGDEIGVVAKADHMKPCPVCARHFQDYLKGFGLEPTAFGKKTWDEVIPFAAWKEGAAADAALSFEKPEDAVNFYYSTRFLTYSTARFYEPASKELLKSGIHVSPLMGPTPTWDGHSLDYFEFYDVTPSTAITWETSNRDGRVWQWESYLATITQNISQRHDLPVHVYVKPHRGAPTQRLFAVLSRGVKSICWYCYGPPYMKGDEFTAPDNEPLMLEVGEAVRMVAEAESIAYGAERVPKQAEVALVYPRTPFNLRRGAGSTNHFQDAKWVYLALVHEQAPVDVIGEAMIEEGGLKGRKALYLVGSHLRRKSAEIVRDWVKSGGTLWTDIEGLSRDEFDQISETGQELTGQKNRAIELWGADSGYKATRIEPFVGQNKQPYRAPEFASITLRGMGVLPMDNHGQDARATSENKSPAGNVTAAVGREILLSDGAEILGTFADGKPALIRRKVGAGQVFVVGTFAGLAYSEKVRRADYDMARDLEAPSRRLIAFAALEAGVNRPAIASDPLVETALVRNGKDAALYLMNWRYRGETSQGAKGRPSPRDVRVPAANVRIALPPLRQVAAVQSAGGNRINLVQGQNGLSVVIEQLDAGDILLFRDVTFADSAIAGISASRQ
jgi:hypothetical protein